MVSCEFQTVLRDGIIHVPLEYRNKLIGRFKVILIEEKDDKAELRKNAFPYFAIDTTGYVFNREEANER